MTYEVRVIFALLTNEKISLEKGLAQSPISEGQNW